MSLSTTTPNKTNTGNTGNKATKKVILGSDSAIDSAHRTASTTDAINNSEEDELTDENENKNKNKSKETKATETTQDNDNDETEDEDDEVLSSVLSQLKEKPSAADIEHDLAQRKANPNLHSMSDRSEVFSFFLYDWANSPEYNVLLGLVYPLFLYILATEYACEHNTLHKCDINYDPIESSSKLRVQMGGWEMKPSSFAYTMISLSGALQAVAYICFGGLADFAHYRFYLFRILTLIACSLNVIYFFCWDASTYLFVGWLGAIQLVFFGLTLIYYNSTLPDIIENHWLVRRARRDRKSSDDMISLKQRLSDDISQFGYALGYCGSLLMTIVVVLIFVALTDNTHSIFKHYGLQSDISDLSSTNKRYDEFWLKPVNQIAISFTPKYITSIQLFYRNIDIDGDIYPSANIQSGYTVYNESQAIYTIPEKGDYISQIELWYNDDDNSLRSLQFESQSGNKSRLFGNQNVIMNNEDSDVIEGDDKVGNFIFAGYKVYTATNLVANNSEIVVVSGLDVVMLNEKTGQWGSTISYRIIYLLVFFWWFCFQLPVFKYIKRRDKPAIPEGESVFTISAKEFYHAFKQAQDYPNMFRFLIIWFLYSDALNTLLTTSVLFAREYLGLSSTMTALILLEILAVTSVGGVMFLKIQRHFEFDARQMIIIHLFVFVGLSIYPLFGFLPGCPFGLCHTGEIYFYAFVMGLNMGAIQSYSRSCFASLIPLGMEAKMFALFEITDKGSSWMGPLMMAFIGNHTTIRWGMLYSITFFAIPIPVMLYYIDIKQGMADAGRGDIEAYQPSTTSHDGIKRHYSVTASMTVEKFDPISADILELTTMSD